MTQQISDSNTQDNQNLDISELVPHEKELSLSSMRTPEGLTYSAIGIGTKYIQGAIKHCGKTWVYLVMTSLSMRSYERKYWIDLSSTMSDQQIDKLKGILSRERISLATITQKEAGTPYKPKTKNL